MYTPKQQKTQQSRAVSSRKQYNKIQFCVRQYVPHASINLEIDSRQNTGLNNIDNRLHILSTISPGSEEVKLLNQIKGLCIGKENDLHIYDEKIDYNQLKISLEDYSQRFKQGRNVESVISLVKAHIELQRILSIQLQNNSTRQQMSSVRFSIIPNNKKITELPEFTSLIGQNTGVGGVRNWEKVRGVGGVKYNGNTYVGVAEENLLGLTPIIGERYAKGYSTATHEIAHSIHLNGLQKFKKNIITQEYDKRKKIIDNKYTVDKNDWVDGIYIKRELNETNKINGDLFTTTRACYASQNEQEYFAQLSNAYLGTNTGKDPFTGYQRNNGKKWVKDNEPQMFDLLETIYKDKSVNDVDSWGSLKDDGVSTNPLP